MQPCTAYACQSQSQQAIQLQSQPNTDDTGDHIYDEVNMDDATRSGGHSHQIHGYSNRSFINDLHVEYDDSGEYALADGGVNGDRYSLDSEKDTNVDSTLIELEDSMDESYVEPNTASQLNAPYRVTVYSKNGGSLAEETHDGETVTEGYLTVIQS